MPLDPQARAYLDLMASSGIPAAHTVSVEEARASMVARRALINAQPEEVAKIENRAIPGPAGQIPVRIYTPAGEPPSPLLVFYHGGGWVIGSLDSHDGLCCALANRGGCVVLSVDYRLAPEHKFPAAADDCYAATLWAREQARELGADGSRLAVGGDSAGGNLAAVVSLMARDRGGPPIRLQLLVYPVTDHSYETPSYSENATGVGLDRDAMVWFWNHYLASSEDGRNPYASPLQAADLSGLPPAYVITAENDVLRDEGEAYAERLRQAGVPMTCIRYPGMIHGFFGNAAVMDQAKQAVDAAGASLRQAFTS